MRHVLCIVMSLIAGLLMSCSTGASSVSSSPGVQAPEQDQSVIIRVGIFDGPMLPGAKVLLVTSSGIELLGVTDSVGVAKIPNARLSASDAYALLVCAEHFHCGAFRVDQPGFLASRDQFIALAPFTIH